MAVCVSGSSRSRMFAGSSSGKAKNGAGWDDGRFSIRLHHSPYSSFQRNWRIRETVKRPVSALPSLLFVGSCSVCLMERKKHHYKTLQFDLPKMQGFVMVQGKGETVS